MTWKKRWNYLFKRNRIDGEIDEEIRYHVERQIEVNLAAGMSPREARYAALREFGGAEQFKEECRSARGVDWLDHLAQDVRFAWRNFRRSPGFALTVIGVTALGIGATTAVFSVVDRVLFRSLPYADSDRLVSFGAVAPILEFDFLTGSTYLDLKRKPAPMEAVTSWSGLADCDLTDNPPVRLTAARVESTFLPLLGIQPQLGRNFTAEEDVPKAPRVALISDALWRTRFGAQPDVVGRQVSLDGESALIVGVLPPHFELPTLDKADLLIPQMLPVDIRPGFRVMRVYGRLPRGMSAATAQAAAAPFLQSMLADAPPQYRNEIKLRIRSLRDLQSGDVRIASWTLFAAVAAMLLIACANVANLLLARAMVRQRELAVRAALGAGRSRLVRQTLTENLLLSLAGGAAGCLLASTLLKFFVLIAPAGLPHLAKAELDWRVLLFALLGSIACGFLFALAPALHTPRPETLTGTRVAGSSSLVARHVLVGAQLAVSLILLTSAGLLIQSLWKRQSVSLGLRTDRIVTAQIALGPRYSQPPARLEFFEQLEARLKRMPGAESVALSDSLPPGGVPRTQPFFAVEAAGRAPYKQGVGGVIAWRHVTPDYFQALGIQLLRGRLFTDQDRTGAEPVIILSQSFARKLFPEEDALQKYMRRFPGGPWHLVIGIVSDARNAGLSDENNPEYYVVRRHKPEDALYDSALIVRGTAKPGVIASWIRSEVASLDPAVPAVIRTFDDHIGELAARPRFQAVLLALFAGMGLILAASGLYGLIAFLVAQREREIGVRLALGASPSEIKRMILSHAMRWTLSGVIIGAAGAALAARALRTLLFHVSPADPFAFGAAVILLLALAAAAALLPSRRAAALDPMVTLRQE